MADEGDVVHLTRRITLYYMVFGALWFVYAYLVMPEVPSEMRPNTALQGFLFVMVSGLVVYLVTRRVLRGKAEAETRVGRFRQLFEGNVAGMYLVTTDGDVLDCNDELAAIFGYESPEALQEDPPEALYRREGDGETTVDGEGRDWLETVLTQGTLRNYEQKLVRPDGEAVWVLQNATVFREPKDGPAVISGTMVDITERKELEEKLARYAYHDPLTGLPNRRLLEEHAETALGRSSRQGKRSAVLYLDLSQFKRVNDSFGHQTGDEVLARVASRLQDRTRQEDTLARIGGDEFAVLLAAIDDPAGAESAARRVLEALDEPVRVEGRDVQLTGRVGIALFPEHGRELETLIRCADVAMYRADQDDRVRVYEGDASDVERDPLEAEERLREALEDGDWTLHYQTLVRVDTEEPVALEGLSRWPGAPEGYERPGEFVPLAERTGLIEQIDRRSIERAMRAAARVVPESPLEWISVNVSPETLLAPDFPGWIAQRQDELRPPEDSLMLEVTERTTLRNRGDAAAVLEKLRQVGVRLAIDDFGTGYSALSYLRDLPVEMLKVDMHFLWGLERKERAKELLRLLIQMGKTLGLTVAAEGVEFPSQLERLREFGCDLAQGYRYGRPAPIDELDVLEGVFLDDLVEEARRGTGEPG